MSWWITLAVLAVVAGWFEYHYRRTQRGDTDHASGTNTQPTPVSESNAKKQQGSSKPDLTSGKP